MHLLSRVFAILFLPLLAVAAPLRWHWSNPLPHGNNIAGLAFHADWGHVQVADHGQLYTSQDLTAWSPNATGTLKALRSVSFFGSRLIVTGESGLILWADQPDDLRLLDLGTADWLEDVAASPTKLVAVGDNGAIYTSATGTNWVRQSSGFTDWLRGVAWGPGGTGGSGVFVAVGEDGRIANSTDGVSWTERNSTVTTHLNRVTWTGTLFMVVGEGGTVLVSNGGGGGSWTRQTTTGATGDLTTVAMETAITRLVGGENELRLNTGSAWADQLATTKPAPAPKATYLATLWDGTNLLAGGRTGLTVTGRRPSAAAAPDWTTFPSPTRDWLFDVTTATGTGTNLSAALDGGAVRFATNRTANTFYVAVGDQATIVTSDNGVRWDTSLVPASASNSVYLGVAGDARGLVAVGSRGAISFSPVAYVPLNSTNTFTNGATATQVVLTNQVNTLGLAWYASPSPTGLDLQAACAGAGLYLVGGDQGFLATSSDGTNWTARTSGTTRFLSGLAAWPGGFVAVGDRGTILTSPDGVAWANRSVATTNWLYRVRWLGGQLVAVGQNGALYTSSDATAWTARTSGTTSWINDVTHVGGVYHAVANQGVLLTSPDAVTWTTDTSIISGKSLYGAATRDGQLVIVGIEGLILRAQVGPFPSPVGFVAWPQQPADQLFFFSGRPDQRFRLDRSPDLKLWTPGPELEITNPDGTLLLFDDTTNNVPDQFFRALGL